MNKTSTVFISIHLFFQILFLLVNGSTSWAGNELREFYSGVRCLGMGGACVAVVNDETALIVNPAALGKLRDLYGTIIDPEIESSGNNATMYSTKAYSNPIDLTQVKETADATREKYYHWKGQIFPSIVGKNFGLGLLGTYTLDAEMNSAGTEMDTYYRNDYALVFGYNFRFFDGRIKLGFNGKIISRIEVNNSTLDPTGALDLPTIASEGTGFSTDVGLILAAPWTYIPTLSAVVRNVGGTRFDKKDGLRLQASSRPTELKQDMDVGIAIFPINSNRVRSTWTVEYRGVLTVKDETDTAKRIHAGFELNMYDILFLRAGYNQRYWTAGLELSSEHIQIQVASYGEEIGTVDSTREDRRLVGKFALRF
jgi:hypothetical protein